MRRPTMLKRSSTGSLNQDAQSGLSIAASSGTATVATSNDAGALVAADAGSASTAGVKLVVQENAQLCKALTEWMTQQRKTMEKQLTEQERLVNTVVQSHQRTIQELKQLTEDMAAREPLQTSETHVPATIRKGGTPAVGDLDHEPGDPEAPESKNDTAAAATAIVDLQDGFNEDEALLDSWRRCSGLHTVDKWVLNYRKHPAGWGALLMIQGIPEVTGRLRNKVENYAIYSALFLSVSIGLLISPPSSFTTDIDADQWTSDWWESHIRRRIYIYCFGIGTAFHMLSILLAMAFCNALNETARDSDVFRIFARGKGYFATVRTQNSFVIGCVADLLAIMVASTLYITWVEVLVGTASLVAVTGILLKKTKRQLFVNGSIVKYWREELGGQPDADDPYDLQVPADCFRRRSAASHMLSKMAESSSDMSAWRRNQAAPTAQHQQQQQRPGNRRGTGATGRAAVAAIF